MRDFVRPGRLLHLQKSVRDGSESDEGAGRLLVCGVWCGCLMQMWWCCFAAAAPWRQLVELPSATSLDYVVISRSFIRDHLCATVEEDLDALSIALHGDKAAEAGITGMIGPEDEDAEDATGMYGGVDWRPRRVFFG